MQSHFVTFYSPGTFVAEMTEKPIDIWDVEKAQNMARDICERHGAKPYGFRFSTRGRGDDDLDSKVVKTSPMYFLGGKIETLKEVKARATKNDSILIFNMESNGFDRIITNTNSWRSTLSMGKDDVVLDWKP
jgi:hypothetical protein